jgi:ankyrin repeat protein
MEEADGVCRGRLSSSPGILAALESDNGNFCQQWLNDPQTNIDDTEEEKQQTAIMVCSWHNSTKCLKMLLQGGANINLVLDSGASALYIAAQRGHEDCMSLLIRFGANVNASTKNGATPLFMAALSGNMPCLALLVSTKHLNLNARTSDGTTALFAAAHNNHAEVLELLVKAGAYTKAVDKKGSTAMDAASSRGHTECMQILLEASGPVKGRLNKDILDALQQDDVSLCIVFDQETKTP